MQPLKSLSHGALVDIIRRQPDSKERTNVAWQLAVGPAIARATTVFLADGVLTVGAADPRWIREIERARDIVLLKMQAVLGTDQVTRLKTRNA